MFFSLLLFSQSCVDPLFPSFIVLLVSCSCIFIFVVIILGSVLCLPSIGNMLVSSVVDSVILLIRLLLIIT